MAICGCIIIFRILKDKKNNRVLHKQCKTLPNHRSLTLKEIICENVSCIHLIEESQSQMQSLIVQVAKLSVNRIQIQDGAEIPASVLLGGWGVSAATTTTTTTFSLPTLLASTPVTSTKCTYSLAGNIPPANSQQNIGGHSGYMMPNNQWSMGMNPSQLNGVGAHMYGQHCTKYHDMLHSIY